MRFHNERKKCMQNMHDTELTIEVCYAASAQDQWCLPLGIPHGTTVKDAIVRSGILTLAPEIDLTTNLVGIFSKKVTLDVIVKEGDRIEIYRPLCLDPKAKRLTKVKRRL